MNNSQNRSAQITTAALLITTALLSFAPIAILGSAIGWPASLGNPAAMQLAAIGRAPGAVQLGYGVYLLYSILIAPVMILLCARAFKRDLKPSGFAQPLVIMVVVFASLSALARSVGILRWLSVMPELSLAHAAADLATKQSIELVFKGLHVYGGAIGELLGVSLFMAAAVGLFVIAAWREAAQPKPLLLLGALSAALLLALFMPAVGIRTGVPVAAAVTSLSVWMLATGGWLLWASRRSS